MSFFKNISDFFQSIFMASSPEVKQKQALKKLASDLKNTDPQIYRDGSVLPPFADALKIMFENTKPIMDILSDTAHTIATHFGSGTVCVPHLHLEIAPWIRVDEDDPITADAKMSVAETSHNLRFLIVWNDFFCAIYVDIVIP